MSARVLVLGGGPAGLATAAVLARHGVEASVCDAGVYGRPKMCGEFLSPDAQRALEEIGAEGLVRALDPPSIEAVRVTVGRRRRVVSEAARPLDTPGHGVSRVDFDATLAEAVRRAGATVAERCRVGAIECREGGVRASGATGTMVVDAIVVATGRAGGMGRAEPPAERDWVAIKTHVRGVRLPRVTELHFVRGAYVGLNEVCCLGERVVNVCALASRAAWQRAGASAEGLWDLLAALNPAFAERWLRAVPVEGSFVAASGFGFHLRGAAGEGPRPPLFVGDAAAVIAPLSGDGQAMALTGGASLGAILAERADRLDDAAVRDAAGVWRREFAASYRRRLRFGRALQRLMLRPRSASFMVRASRAVPPLSSWIYRRTRGPLRV